MSSVLIPATNRTFNTHYFKYWGAPTTNLYMGGAGLVTLPQQVTNITFGTSFITTGSYLFSLRVTTTNSAKGSASIIYPWTETTSGSTPIGYNHQVISGYYAAIQVTVTPIYPNTFKGWYSAYSGGTLYSTSATVNVASYNNALDDWYAQWN